jgi:hypothetical protein
LFASCSRCEASSPPLAFACSCADRADASSPCAVASDAVSSSILGVSVAIASSAFAAFFACFREIAFELCELRGGLLARGAGLCQFARSFARVAR